MNPTSVIEVPKTFLVILNNLSDIERKLALHGDQGNAIRNVERIKEVYSDQKIFYEDPMGQPFNETRTDLEATITGEGTEGLKVVEVIKPIIRIGDKNYSKVIQKGIVIVQSTKEGKQA